MEALPELDRPITQLDSAGPQPKTYKASLLPALVAAGAVLVLSVGIALVSDLYGSDRLKAALGIVVTSDPFAQFTPADFVRVDALNEQMLPVIKNLDALLLAIDTADQQQMLADQKVAALEASVAGMQEEIDQLKAQLEESLEVARAKPQRSEKVRKSSARSTLVLVSIRTQGGRDLATVRSSDVEKLLMMGDSWRGWTLVSADPSKGKAVFRVGGKTRVLVL